MAEGFLSALLTKYNRIVNNGTILPQRSALNVIGATITDDPANDATNLTIGGGGGGGVTAVTASAPLASSGGATPDISLAGIVSVPQGGTGLATLTAHGVVIGQGAGPVAVTAVGTAGQVLTSNGPGVDPTFQAGLPGPPGPAGAGPAGTVGVTGFGNLVLAGDTVDVNAPCATPDRAYMIFARVLIRAAGTLGSITTDDSWADAWIVLAKNIGGVVTIVATQRMTSGSPLGDESMSASGQCGFVFAVSGTNVVLTATGNGNNTIALVAFIGADIMQGM